MHKTVATTAFIVFIVVFYVSAYQKVVQRFRHYDFVMMYQFKNALAFAKQSKHARAIALELGTSFRRFRRINLEEGVSLARGA